jgi:tetratricopeptide (TPR) repeat protein
MNLWKQAVLSSLCSLTFAAALPCAASTPPAQSPLDAQLFYQLLIGELQLRQGSPGAGFSIILDAARKTRDPALYQRAVDIALQSRSGDAALQAAQTWRSDFPQAPEPLRYLLQIQIAMGKLEDAGKTLRESLTRLPADEQSAAIATIPRVFARAVDKAQATRVVETALEPALRQAGTAAVAWTTIGRMRRDTGQTAAAVEAAVAGHAASPTADGPLILAISLLDSGDERLTPLLDAAVSALPEPGVWTAYARALLSLYESAHARDQLERLLQQHPRHAPAWLLLGLTRLDQGDRQGAERDLRHFLDLLSGQRDHAGSNTSATAAYSAAQVDNPSQTGQSEALLALSQIALQQGQAAQAQAWLEQLPAETPVWRSAPRRADVLALQGQSAQARALLADLPASNADERRQKNLLQAHWLREQGALQEAYDLLKATVSPQTTETDLLNELAVVCEKLQRFEEMEQLLRQAMRLRPLDPQAYNALGYSLADRNLRLDEARALIQKAVELAPRDPFIRDSLGWVAFRQGRLQEARDLLASAFKARPDAEIAAHLGEVLWSIGQQDEARRIWRQGLDLRADHQTLRETLRRLQVSL